MRRNCEEHWPCCKRMVDAWVFWMSNGADKAKLNLYPKVGGCKQAA